MIRYENLRQQLIARRKQLGLTQTALAHKMGLTPTSLNGLETGLRSNPTLETLAVWCRALDARLNLDVTFDYEDPSANTGCGLDRNSPADACTCTDTCLKRQQLTEASR